MKTRRDPVMDKLVAKYMNRFAESQDRFIKKNQPGIDLLPDFLCSVTLSVCVTNLSLLVRSFPPSDVDVAIEEFFQLLKKHLYQSIESHKSNMN